MVTWGEQTKEFTKEQLAAGINLAAEFDKTPFDKPVRRAAGGRRPEAELRDRT